mmetsp:Transcript_38161/g.110187  ORF Transcript_38161/g.110187 Transcript_38161/m.110187 type:complete len:223 (+) Transcript_38161:943-1611(+)
MLLQPPYVHRALPDLSARPGAHEPLRVLLVKLNARLRLHLRLAYDGLAGRPLGLATTHCARDAVWHWLISVNDANERVEEGPGLRQTVDLVLSEGQAVGWGHLQDGVHRNARAQGGNVGNSGILGVADQDLVAPRLQVGSQVVSPGGGQSKGLDRPLAEAELRDPCKRREGSVGAEELDGVCVGLSNVACCNSTDGTPMHSYVCEAASLEELNDSVAVSGHR